MLYEKHGPQVFVMTKTLAGSFSFPGNPLGHVLHTAWETWIKCCNKIKLAISLFGHKFVSIDESIWNFANITTTIIEWALKKIKDEEGFKRVWDLFLLLRPENSET